MNNPFSSGWVRGGADDRLRPQGTLIAGCPVTSKGQVLLTISSARWTMSEIGALAGGSSVAFIGCVGVSSRS